MRFPLTLLLAALAVAGCSGVEAPADAGERGSTVEEQTPRWKGARARTYRRAYRICSVFTVEEIARQRGVKPRARTAARAFARWHYPRKQRKAGFHGCLDGFRGRARGA